MGVCFFTTIQMKCSIHKKIINNNIKECVSGVIFKHFELIVVLVVNSKCNDDNEYL